MCISVGPLVLLPILLTQLKTAILLVLSKDSELVKASTLFSLLSNVFTSALVLFLFPS